MENAVRTIFRETCSTDAAKLAWANEKLNELCPQPEFLVSSVNLIMDSSEDAKVRLQSVLYLKNKIDLLWKESQATLPLEKAAVKSTLLRCYLDIPDYLVLHTALLISKITRMDCPQSWPELLPFLSNVLGQPELVSGHPRVLQVLYMVVKALASRRLPADKRAFAHLCHQIFPSLSVMFTSHLQSALSEQQLNFSVRCAKMAFKALRVMLLYGIKPADAPQDVVDFIGSLPSFSSAILKFECSVNSLSEDDRESLLKIAQAVWKFALSFRQLYVLEFVRWLKIYISHAFDIAFRTDAVILATLPQSLLVRCLCLLNEVLHCQEYKVQNLSEPVECETTLAALNMMSEVLCVENLSLMCQCLLVSYLKLSEADIQLYCEDPEGYVTEEIVTSDSEAWRFSLKPAAAALYVGIVHEYWKTLTSQISEWSKELMLPLSFDDSEQFLRRDCIIVAIGLAASELYDLIDFDALFSTVVFPFAVTQQPSLDSIGHRLLIRRLIWLCGRWVSVKFSTHLRPQLYKLLCDILTTSTVSYDMGLRLTAVAALKNALDDYGFVINDFQAFTGAAVSGLIETLKLCKEDDSKSAVLQCLSLLIEVAGNTLQLESIEAIIRYIPQLWSSQQEHSVKCQILSLLCLLVKVLRTQSEHLRNGICQLLETAVDTSLPSHVYLMEVGLDLWLCLVENTRAPMPDDLRGLFRFVPSILVSESENIKICMEIVKAYCAFVDVTFAEVYLTRLADVFVNFLEKPQLTMDARTSVLRTVEFIIKCYKSKAFASMSSVIMYCLSIIASEETALAVVVLALSIVSSVVCEDPERVFATVLRSFGETAVENFLDTWIKKLSLISHDLERKKICGLGLCASICVSRPEISNKFPVIMKSLVDVLDTLSSPPDENDEANVKYTDLVAYDFGIVSNDDDDGLPLSEHDTRCQQMRCHNVVYTVPFNEFLRMYLKRSEQSWGPDVFRTLWESVEASVRDHIQSLM